VSTTPNNQAPIWMERVRSPATRTSWSFRQKSTLPATTRHLKAHIKLPRSITTTTLNGELEVELDNVARHRIIARAAGLFHDMVVCSGDIPRHPDPCQRECQRNHLVWAKHENIAMHSGVRFDALCALQ